jgi:hypothetical protein
MYDNVPQVLQAMDEIKRDFRNSLFALEPVPDELFQYTDIQGLYGILKELKWRATHSSYLNDSREITFGDEMICELLEQRLSTEQDEQIKHIYEEVISSNYGKRSVNWAFDNDIYLISFSENGDLLDQWRAYAANGLGYSIGINPHQLSHKISERVIVPAHDEDLAFVKVVYDNNRQREWISFILERVANIIGEIAASSPQNQLDQLYGTVIRPFGELLAPLTLIFKDSAFANERERRVIKTRWGRHVSRNNFPDDLSHTENLQFWSSDNKLIPYLELDFSARNNEALLPLSKIILGPKHRHSNARESLEMLLASLGYQQSDLLIQASSIAYQ